MAIPTKFLLPHNNRHSNTRKEDCTSAEPFFVRVFGVVLKRVFRGKKNSGLLFKITLIYFDVPIFG